MKKLLCVLILICVLPSAIAEEGITPDPILGCWYADMELNGDIVIKGYEEYTRFLLVLSFESTGEIIRFEIDYNGKTTETSGPTVVGRWERTAQGEYMLSVLALGKEKAYIIDDNLYAIAVVKNMYYCFHKMMPFDWYQDMYIK